jgi:hypothetical protein
VIGVEEIPYVGQPKVVMYDPAYDILKKKEK